MFVKKWIKTRHATMFRLSNNLIQSIFDDGSEIIFNSAKDVTYVSNTGTRKEVKMAEAINSMDTGL